MSIRPSVLCPIDFSAASAGALRYAAVIAAHFATRLIVLTVENPLLTQARDLGTGIVWSPEDCQREMEQFAAKTLGAESSTLPAFEYEVAVGKPAAEILRVARERSCQLIVISTHGLTGIRKLFFGSTTERVLRETTVPVLVTPPLDAGPVRVEDARRVIGRIVVPVDLSPASRHQTQVAYALAEALGAAMILVHVIEPLKTSLAARLNLARIEVDRRAIAEEGLGELVALIPSRLNREALVVNGDPAEELSKVVHDRHADLVVMGLHGSPLFGPRMGSVTYRLLCLHPALVLALPPKRVDATSEEIVTKQTAAGTR